MWEITLPTVPNYWTNVFSVSFLCRLDSISEYGRDIGAQASKLKTVIVNMTDDLGDEEPVILNKQTEFEKLSRIGTVPTYGTSLDSTRNILCFEPPYSFFWIWILSIWILILLTKICQTLAKISTYGTYSSKIIRRGRNTSSNVSTAGMAHITLGR